MKKQKNCLSCQHGKKTLALYNYCSLFDDLTSELDNCGLWKDEEG